MNKSTKDCMNNYNNFNNCNSNLINKYNYCSNPTCRPPICPVCPITGATGPTGPTGASGPTGPAGIFNLVDGNTSGSVRGINTPDNYYMGIDSVAIGRGTISKGIASFAQGINSVSNGIAAVAQGDGTTAEGVASHAEGVETNAIGITSHAEGEETTASGISSHAEGSQTNAQGNSSHAEGNLTSAVGGAAHAEGLGSNASGLASHAEGDETIASGTYSHAGGSSTIAQGYAQTVIGRWNVASGNADIPVQTDNAFIIGNGFFGIRNNAFRVQFNGDMNSATGLYTTGADYAEMFEWHDENPHDEDRIGYFVTLDGKYIRKANNFDQYILGVVSASSSVVGDSQGCGWQGMYLQDRWGRTIYDWVDEQREINELYPQTGEAQIRTETVRIQRPRLNPEYNPDRTYQPRMERSEWAAVGMIGKLRVRNDGSCKPNGFCQPNADGIATSSSQGYRVLDRLDENTVLICFK